MKALRLFLLALACAAAATASAQIPQIISYQGRVAVDAVNFDGPGLFKFALVNEDGSVTFWSNDDSSAAGSEPAAAVPLTVARGLYSVLLGDLALMSAVPPTVFANPDVRLRVWFDDGVNGSQLLTPDQRTAAVGYAMVAGDVPDGAITSAKIAAGTITGDRLAPATVDATHLLALAAPAPGEVLSYNGTEFVWVPAAGGGGGDSVFSLNGTSAYYLNGNVGLGTATPVHRLAIGGGQPAWTSNSWGGAVELTNGSAFAWATNAGGRRFGLGHTNTGFAMFRTSSDPGTTGSPALYDFFINDSGNVGINTISPASKFTVQTSSVGLGAFRAGLEHTDGAVRLGTYAEPTYGGWIGTISNHPLNFFVNDGLPSMTISGGGISMASSSGFFTVGSPNGETGASLQRGGNRGDIRFEGTSLKLVAGLNAGPPGSLSGIAVNVSGNVGIGTTNPASKLEVIGTTRTSILTITGGADIAEPFPMKEDALEKGSVVVIDDAEPGRLKRSTAAYDRRVAGIVSGANGINAGISLRQEGVMDGGQNVALSGRVYVRADASGGAIQPGDMLTTSDRPGHAMRVDDHARAQGAIIGKAMSALAEGEGLVLVLVSLQ